MNKILFFFLLIRFFFTVPLLVTYPGLTLLYITRARAKRYLSDCRLCRTPTVH